MSAPRPTTPCPIGLPVPAWRPPAHLAARTIAGTWCRLEPLAEAHAAALFEAHTSDSSNAQWIYLAYGPFESAALLAQWIAREAADPERECFAVLDSRSNRALGSLAFLRSRPANGSVEIGSVAFSPLLQRTTPATEALFLLMREAFEHGYRRLEWKCDALNEASRAAAQRLGFVYEGTFRQDNVYRGRNRDTAWFSIIDSEWPELRGRCEAWLSPGNFDERGQQRVRLRDCRSS